LKFADSAGARCGRQDDEHGAYGRGSQFQHGQVRIVLGVVDMEHWPAGS
jgi:hypothetical protein